MALKVQQRLAGHIAKLGKLNRSQPVFALPEASQVVELRFFMLQGQLIPALPVGLQVLIHEFTTPITPAA